MLKNCEDSKCTLQHHNVHVYNIPNPEHPTGIFNLLDNESETGIFMTLCQRLEEELWAAKRRLPLCSKILLPTNLLRRIARDLIEVARFDLIKVCIIYLHFKGEYGDRLIGMIQCDTDNEVTFKIHVTLKQNTRNRWSFIPVFIRNLIKGDTVTIDHEFTIE